jgi:ComF family protein
MPPKKNIRSYPQMLFEVSLDILFPKKCVACGSEGVFLCQNCLAKITPKETQTCLQCEREETFLGSPCFGCQKKAPLPIDNLLIASRYEGPLKRAVHFFKYGMIEELGIPLGNFLNDFFLSSRAEIPEIILPVPLHPFRLRSRGFNQAEVLAREIGKSLLPGMEIPLSSALCRIRHTGSQMKKKKYQERFLNIQDSFRLKNPEEIAGRRILLIDDVATTGATLFECAKVLKEGGARKVSALVLARQEINP